jgi:hypothetical protein
VRSCSLLCVWTVLASFQQSAHTGSRAAAAKGCSHTVLWPHKSAAAHVRATALNRAAVLMHSAGRQPLQQLGWRIVVACARGCLIVHRAVAGRGLWLHSALIVPRSSSCSAAEGMLRPFGCWYGSGGPSQCVGRVAWHIRRDIGLHCCPQMRVACRIAACIACSSVSYVVIPFLC